MRAAGNSSNRIHLVMRAMTARRLPKNKFDPIYPYYYKDYSGESFIIDLHSLINAPASKKHIAEYLALAALRNYSYYTYTNDASLELLHSPMGEEKLKQNRLLSIANGRIHFKYEEVTKGELKHG